jgi:hypothetical protein
LAVFVLLRIMRWKSISPNLSAHQFRRLTGVKKSTFTKMCLIVKTVKQQRRKHPIRGKQAKLCIEDQVLMMLMYNREYRSYLHISADYGISESQCWRIIDDVQNILIQSKTFRLPGKKKLIDTNVKWSVVLIDVGESPIERPKKNSVGITQVKRKSIH